MASTVLPDISLDYKAGPRISPPFGHLPPLSDPLQTRASTSLISGTFQFVDEIFWASLPSLEDVSSYAFDGRAKCLYLLRRSDPVVAILDASGNVLHQWTAAQTGIKDGTAIKLRYTDKSSSDSVIVWVADSGDFSIRAFDVNGQPVSSFAPILVPEKPGFGKITDLAWDSSGNVYVTRSAQDDGGAKQIALLSAAGDHLKTWGAEGIDSNEVNVKDPIGVSVDSSSRAWVVNAQDSGQDNHLVHVVSETGGILTSFKLPLPGFRIIEVRFSEIRCRENTGLLYIVARKLGILPLPGFLILVEVQLDRKIPGGIGVPILPPLLACMIPDSTFRDLSLEDAGSEPGYFYLLSRRGPDIRIFHLGDQRPLRNTVTRPGPRWPDVFTAILILHPFRGDESLAVARLDYDYPNRAMMFHIYTQDGRYHTLLYSIENGSMKLYVWSKSSQWLYWLPSTLEFPSPDWLQNTGVDLQGNLPLRNVPVDWWHQEFGKQREANWHWFRSDSNPSLPFRTMNVNTTNPNHLPVLGDYAFIYWPYVTPKSNGIPELEKALTDIKSHDVSKLNKPIDPLYVPRFLNSLRELEGPLDPSEKEENLQRVSSLIPGFKFGDGGLKLPLWPQQFFMSCTMTPINRPTPLSTEVTYDWPSKSQRTRMFEGLFEPVIDCQLFNQTAHILRRWENLEYQKLGDIPGLGPPRPDWATAGGGEIMATITDNPVLSPGTVTRIFHAPINPPYQFWIWYSTLDTPVVFMQTEPTVDEGTSLALADYKVMQPTELIDPHTFDIPY